ncbi:betaine/proline/choline family ABC transporter ATP-binding protein [Planococcus sp. N028]|uniref:Quaternary amine transport ATP-binding protein n=1 Tax=Planococcus shixiaomingii TaxID=3058393 RepID=A0ABT8N600_9BACL|nr:MULTISPECIES: betaine/proline/choline family ABC transporter ATP-binding protein [unclassified Planococcus (in: firmicutes)]MDN7243314.1 betaine/proline/choline family ABC transporter ATP-binding protein [Planococcus sp. N028]WKA55256.1 betaine/proline/choline family ABC transporter ATP-binding protein [Planococcus sp. N022]
MIRFENVSRQFPDGTEALKNISLTLPDQQLTVIIGPSGCGKTTLMKMINKMEKPTAGNIYIDEKPITGLDEVQLRRSIGYVIQRIGLFPHMTISDNVSLVPRLLSWPKEKTTVRVHELLELVGLDPNTYLERFPLELSGGQQQRVGVVRALAGDPDIVLMDEPFSALDPISREQLQNELRNLQQTIHKTIVFVTHDMDEALKIADTIVVMRQGQIEQIGTPHQLVNDPANEFVRNFIGIDRIRQKRSFGERQLKDFIGLFEKEWAGDAQKIDSSSTIEEAVRQLGESRGDRLAITENDRVLAYASERDLLNAALLKEGGALV